MDANTDTSFVLQNADGWLIYLFIAAAFLVAWWGWRRYGPAPLGVSGFISKLCRVLVMVAVIALLTGPAMRTTTTTTLPGRLVVAVDRSASMARADGPQQLPRIAMASALYQALAEVDSSDVIITWHSIGGNNDDLDPNELEGLSADGGASALAQDVEDLAFATYPDLMVVLSDFRKSEGATLEYAASRLRELGKPAWALGVGTEELDPELLIEEVSGNTIVALGERQPFELSLSARALESDTPIIVEAIMGDEVLASAEIPVPKQGDAVDPTAIEKLLDVIINEEGEHELLFRARQGDLQHELARTVQVSQRKLQVLMLAHRPRYELRYLREALIRDFTVELHAYLGDGRWRRWGADGPSSLPLNAIAIKDYDAIFICDITADQLKRDERLAIAQAVKDNGTGLVWLPGETGNLATFRGDELGKLMPVILPPGDQIMRGYLGDEIVQPKRTVLAEQNAMLESGPTPWHELPDLRGLCPIEKVRDHSRVWMEDQDQRPVVVSAAFGNGQSVFMAVDDTWRWRRNVGDVFLHRFHSQIIRFAASGRAIGDQRWRIEAAPYRTTPGTPVQLAVIPNGALLEGDLLPSSVTLRLRSGEQERLVRVDRAGDAVGYRTLVPAPNVGTWSVRVIDGLPPAEVLADELTVLPPSGEMRDPRFDEVAMTSLVQGTGGKAFIDPQELVRELPALGKQDEKEYFNTLWDRPWVWAILVFLLAVEWSLRRANRLP